MAIAPRIERLLRTEGVTYEVVAHPRTYEATFTAAVSHVQGADLAKAVLLHDEKDDTFVLAVLPATKRVHLGVLEAATHRPFELASETDVAEHFGDCELGAVPPLGKPYGLESIIDDSIAARDDVWFEAGDHVDLVHVTGDDFRRLIHDADLVHFGRPS